MIERGGVHWVDLGEPVGSRAGKRRPVLVVSSDDWNASRIATVVVVVMTSNTELAPMPGNVFVPASASGLPRDSVVNVSALVTLDKADLAARTGVLPFAVLREVDAGLRRSLGL